jgi:hypothetical protein
MERRRALTLTLSRKEQSKNKKEKKKKKTCFALIYLVPPGFAHYYDDCSLEIDIMKKKEAEKK